jgi:hypothetical protein
MDASGLATLTIDDRAGCGAVTTEIIRWKTDEEGEAVLRSIKELGGYAIRAMDDDVGKVREFYFDDQSWTVRYLVADTGNWLVGRRVLISPVSLGYPDWEDQAFPVALTKEQVESSPHISADRPVSRQIQAELHTYYGWPPYWRADAYLAIAAAQAEAAASEERDDDPHLRSTSAVIGYHAQAVGGEIGHVADFIVEDETWAIRYMVVDTRNWLPGKSVLVVPQWTKEVIWAQRKVDLDLSKEAIEKCPEFDPSVPVNREYEVRVYDYYGRPHYEARLGD